MAELDAVGLMLTLSIRDVKIMSGNANGIVLSVSVRIAIVGIVNVIVSV